MPSHVPSIIRDLIASLDDEESDPIHRCGRAITSLFRTCLAQLDLATDGSSNTLLQSQKQMRSLLALADENINAVPFSDVRLEWLRLYTDASIGVALIAMQSAASQGVTGDCWWRDVVRQLDMAIIVAGAPGTGRKAMVQDLIKEVQPRTSEDRSRASKRRRLDKSPAPEPQIPQYFAPRPIPVLDVPPSIHSFISTRHFQPFILRRYFIEDLPWTAFERWSSASDLLSEVGLGRVVPVEIGRSYTDAGWGQRIIPFERFLRLVGYTDAPPAFEEEIEEDKEYTNRPLYLAQHALFSQFPDLERDFSLPDYVYSEPPATPDMPDYTPPGNDDRVVVNVWIGGGKNEVISPAHTDPYYNCYAQVLGRKRVWIAPPSSTPHLYAFEDHGQTDGTATTSYTTNTSKVPIFQQPDEDLTSRFPAYYDQALPNSMEAVLEPGDMLFMPPKWWHAMRSEGHDVSWSVSMWF